MVYHYNNYSKKKRNICDIHDDVLKKADDISKIESRDYDNVEDLLSNVQDIANDIYSMIEEAKDAGMSMEARLADYRNAIEGLGFTRNTKLDVKFLINKLWKEPKV